MSVVHRLVLVAGLFLLIPVGFFTMVLLQSSPPQTPSANMWVVALGMPWLVSALVIYPIAWVVAALRD